MVDKLIFDPHPAVRLEAMLYLCRIWELDRKGFWQRLSKHLNAESNQGVLDHVISGLLARVLHQAPDRVMQLALELLNRFSGMPKRQARMRKALSVIFVILWVKYEQQAAYEVIASWLARPVNHFVELCEIVEMLRGIVVAGLNDNLGTDQDALRHRSQALTAAIAKAVDSDLSALVVIDSPEESTRERVHTLGRLLGAVCLELYFASGADHNAAATAPVLCNEGLRLFFDEIADTLEIIGNNATPHTVYHLLQLMEFMLPTDPARAFDLTAHALCNGGRKTGYQFESLGADLSVKLIGLFLADYKELFADKGRRDALIECLEIFMDAGWPAARRLLYRLPSLLQ